MDYPLELPLRDVSLGALLCCGLLDGALFTRSWVLGEETRGASALGDSTLVSTRVGADSVLGAATLGVASDCGVDTLV